MTQTITLGMGCPAKSQDFVGRGGTTERADFWDILSQSSIAEFVLTSPKAGFGEAPQQAFLQPAGMQK